MRFICKLLLGSLLASLAACAPRLETLQEATLPVYEPDTSGEASLATLRGTYEAVEGLLGHGERMTGVFAIDGKTSFHSNRLEDAIPLEPGLHSLTIGYLNSRSEGDAVPVAFVAEPGASYVIKRERGDNLLDGLKYDRIRTYLYIEDEKTGKIVVPRTPDIISTIEGRYVPPSGPDVARMRGTEDRSLLVSFYAHLIAVDGEIVREESERTLMTVESYNITEPVALTPGLRALAIAVRGGVGTFYLPILFEAKPKESYVVKYEHGLKRHGSVRIFTSTVWIENEADGSVVFPKTDLPTAYYPVL